jgi:hypothetical protein
MENIQTIFIKGEGFSIEDIEFEIKRLTKGKDKNIEGYQVEILNIIGSIVIPHIHNIFNLAINQGFSKP